MLWQYKAANQIKPDSCKIFEICLDQITVLLDIGSLQNGLRFFDLKRLQATCGEYSAPRIWKLTMARSQNGLAVALVHLGRQDGCIGRRYWLLHACIGTVAKHCVNGLHSRHRIQNHVQHTLDVGHLVLIVNPSDSGRVAKSKLELRSSSTDSFTQLRSPSIIMFGSLLITNNS